MSGAADTAEGLSAGNHGVEGSEIEPFKSYLLKFFWQHLVCLCDCKFFYLSAPAFYRSRGHVAFYFSRSMWKPPYLCDLLESLLLDNYGSPAYILDPNLKKLIPKGP